MSARLTVFLAALLGACATPAAVPDEAAAGQRAWAAACVDDSDWDQPGPPFRLSGDTYYVGTCGITALLVTSPHGHVLIDSGTDVGAGIVLANIRTLGFDPRDITHILMSHEHYDHVGGMARVQAATGARIFTTAPAAAVLRTGVVSPADPQAKSGHPPFPRVTGPIETIAPDATIRVGGRTFTALPTPGHTIGATTWTWRDCAGKLCRTFVYADSMNPISSDGYRFSDAPALVKGMREGITRLAAAPCDIVLAPHPSAVAVRVRLAGAQPLVDSTGCVRFAQTVTERLDRRLAQEAGSTPHAR